MGVTRGDIIYRLLKPPVRTYLNRQFNVEVAVNPLVGIKGPYLLLGNHVTNEDPILTNAYANRLIRFISGDANQDNWLKKYLMSLLESIPFAKNAGDAKSIRALVRHVRLGHPVGLYPEGGRNWDGATDYLVPSTGKLVKLLKVPVYAVISKGGYLSRPRWATHPRKGRLVLEIKQLLCRDGIARKSPEEIQALLEAELAHNDFAWQRKHRIPFKGKKLAEHIERLLYVCPHCQGVNSLESRGDRFHCRQCLAEYSINQYGEILGCPQFENTAAWNHWQRQRLPSLAKEAFCYANEKMRFGIKEIRVKSWRRDVVSMTFRPDRLEVRGRKVDEVLALYELDRLSITFKDLVEFYRGKVKYRLYFDPRRHMSVKLFYDLLHTIIASQGPANLI